jgi:predicted HTH transcriptional regulator
MTKEELIQKLSSLEWEDFEVKAAKRELPKSYADAKSRYTYRIEEQENLWEYYFACFERIKQKVDVEFKLTSEGFGLEVSPAQESLREALVNLLMHSDHFSPSAPRIRIFTNQIEFYNPGGMPKPYEELKGKDISLPRNPILAKLFRMVKLAENAGLGLEKMEENWELYTHRAPRYEVEFDSVVAHFDLEKIELTGQVTGQVTGQESSGPESRPESGPESGPESIVKRLLNALKFGEYSRSELAEKLGHKSISGKLKERMSELMEEEFIEYTIPEKPNSRLQKYRLTEKGRKLQENIEK